MKIFVTLLESFDIAGIRSLLPNQEHSLNLRNFVYFFNLLQGSTLSALYFLLEADTMSEYADSFYVVATSLLLFVIYTTLVRNTVNIYSLIGAFEKTIGKS